MISLDTLASAGWRDVLPDTERAVRVRRAEAGDREALARMFDRCTPETRYRRFHGPVKAIPARYLTEALSGTPFHYALVACQAPVEFAADQMPASPGPDTQAGEIVALASCRLIDEGAAELGVLIEDAWQRQGVGTRLLGDLVAYARSTGLRVLDAQLLAEQGWIARLLRPHGTCRVRSTWAGILHVSLRLSEGRMQQDLGRDQPDGGAV